MSRSRFVNASGAGGIRNPCLPAPSAGWAAQWRGAARLGPNDTTKLDAKLKHGRHMVGIEFDG